MKKYEARLLNFKLYEDLSKCTDSMLFDDETCIASGDVEVNGTKVRVDLVVRGYVHVVFKGKDYFKPSEFPIELIEKIKHGKLLVDDDIVLILNNWFEMISYIDRLSDHNGHIKDDLSVYNEELLKDMMIAKAVDMVKRLFITLDDCESR